MTSCTAVSTQNSRVICKSLSSPTSCLMHREKCMRRSGAIREPRAMGTRMTSTSPSWQTQTAPPQSCLRGYSRQRPGRRIGPFPHKTSPDMGDFLANRGLWRMKQHHHPIPGHISPFGAAPTPLGAQPTPKAPGHPPGRCLLQAAEPPAASRARSHPCPAKPGLQHELLLRY